jgi:hypothetical protein
VSIEIDRAFIRTDQTGDHIKDRCFTCAIWPEEPNGLTATNGETDVLDDLAGAIGLSKTGSNEPALT